MKDRVLTRLGKRLMRLGSLRICIVDDEETYFTPEMLEVAKAAGYEGIERHLRVSNALLASWLIDSPDIVILDVKGVADPDVAKDGFGVASQLRRETNAYVVMTSAHQFHLRNVQQDFDYVLEERLLTAVDFLAELNRIVEDYFQRRVRFYKRMTFRLGRSIVRSATLPPAPH